MKASRIGFWFGLILGLFFILFAGVLPRPEGLSVTAIRALGVTVIVGVWWVTEALPLGATALLPAAASSSNSPSNPARGRRGRKGPGHVQQASGNNETL